MFNNCSCSYCKSEINEYCIKNLNGNLQFCNIVCAKLYNDCIEKIDLDYGSYQELIDKQLISRNDSKLYNKFNKLGIDFMPTVYGLKINNNKYEDTDQRKQILDNYVKSLY